LFGNHEDAALARTSATGSNRYHAQRPESDRARIQLDGTNAVLPQQALALLGELLAEMAQGNAGTPEFDTSLRSETLPDQSEQ